MLKQTDIRKAVKEDAAVLLPLYESLIDSQVALQPENYARGWADRSLLENMITESDGVVYLAETDGRISGMIHVKEKDTGIMKALVRHRFAKIEDIVVDEAFRHRGIAGQLIEKVRQWAKERRLDYMELNVLEENEAAKALYRRVGFSPSSQKMQCWI